MRRQIHFSCDFAILLISILHYLGGDKLHASACTLINDGGAHQVSKNGSGSKAMLAVSTPQSKCRYHKSYITYQILYENSQVQPKHFRMAIVTAFFEWHYYIPLTFAEKTKADGNGPADITFLWTTLPMKDAIADTYFPRVYEKVLDGMPLTIRFNQYKRFTFDPAKGSYTVDGCYDLYVTALHEIGHALGLEHTTDYFAIMYPNTRPQLKNLNSTDIFNAQSIYGARRPNPFSNMKNLTKSNTQQSNVKSKLRRSVQNRRRRNNITRNNRRRPNKLRNRFVKKMTNYRTRIKKRQHQAIVGKRKN